MQLQKLLHKHAAAVGALFILVFVFDSVVAGQDDGSPKFRSVVEKRLNNGSRIALDAVCPIDTDPVAERVFRDYGAMFVSNVRSLPARCVFDSEKEVAAFQQTVDHDSINIGGVTVTLQREALKALVEARTEAAKFGLSITPRGGAEASTRSYGKTVDLWRSRFEPALDHWTALRRISAREAAAARAAAIRKQVEIVLGWEEKGLFFSTDLSKSILYSVAAPGASQHIFMLALDVDQFANTRVRQVLAKHGWFQTVKSDLPHFTYLGVTENELPAMGLKPVVVSGQTFWVPNI